MAKLEHTLNYVNLWLEGMTLHADASLTVVTPQEATTENL
ncbi:biopolymer transport protein ExbB [Vibrio cholerae]|nr:TonB system transport protein ExbB1 [Vibrio cholerae]CSA80764.1 biopolymer transport protein ExbB [Vibrio cholerae]CSB53105.1 biopolymer transport protein ExbB [Vibrio cholerae]